MKEPHPYYIFAPSYNPNSSGVRALYLLCNELNKGGQKAYVIPMDGNYQGFATNPYINAPLLTEHESNFYVQNKEPICVVPDVFRGTIPMAKRMVRWLLAPAGQYGGDATFPNTDMVYGYTTPIAKAVGTKRVLLLPTFDRDVYHCDVLTERDSDCFYSHKYDRIHGNALLPATENATRLEGTAEELANIMRRSKRCYVYEMSEVIINAQLCGCEVILVRTPYFNSIPEGLEFPYYNVYWSDTGEVVHKNPHWNLSITDAVRNDVNRCYQRFPRQLELFIEETQAWKV